MADDTDAEPFGDAQELGPKVMRALSKFVGCPAEGVTGLHRTDDGWALVVEVREVERIPETMDVLASYEVEVDGDGEITGFERRRRYQRAQVEGR
jgi:hypothetical protein